ncbi:MAG: Gfo/Idh/MocA family oxidoreductase [Planctomycetes bacterium]|nr:Gfo/Idh/MocA family oxidoreductase [Planctomycetota bacterium]
MIRVGVIGLGMMGNTHLDVYTKRKDVQVVAVSDKNPDRLSGKVRAGGNVKGQAKAGFDLAAFERFDEGMDLIAHPGIDVVDICLPTPLHMKYALAALKAGKHVLLEKPMARTAKDAAKLAKAAKTSKKNVMVAMCMRFWPGWTWLKEAVDNKTYGKVRAAHFRRVANHPGGPFYSDGDQSGGAILDLHIHDTDFIQHVFGVPSSVRSWGYSKETNKIDHVVTHYEYARGGPMIFAEGCWCMSPGFGFSMNYTVNFENATAIFDLAAADTLTLVHQGKRSAVKLDPRMGYELEIDYFLNCVKKGVKPTVVTLDGAANSVKIVEAEAKSIATGKPVKVK